MDGPLQLLTWDTPSLQTRAETLANRFTGRPHSVTVETCPLTAAADPVATAFLEPTSTFPDSMHTALTDGPADIALLPLPVQSLPGGLALAAVLERTHGMEWLVSDGATSLAALAGATIAAPVARSHAQLAAVTADETVCTTFETGTPETAIDDVWTTSLQQTAPTKRAADAEDAFESWQQTLSSTERAALERPLDQPIDAFVAPAAAVAPLESTRVTTTDLSHASLCPAPGQGALGVVTPHDGLIAPLRSRFDDPLTRIETTAERALAAQLPGAVPVGVAATVQGAVVATRVWIQQDAATPITETYEFPVRNHRAAARRAGSDLSARLEE